MSQIKRLFLAEPLFEFISQFKPQDLSGMHYLKRLILIFNTVRHLKPVQIYGRLWKKIWKPKPNLSSPPSKRKLQRTPITPCSRPNSYEGGNQFRFLNTPHKVEHSQDWNNASWSHLWIYNLHYFDFLRSDLSEQTGNHWIDRWVKENPPGTRSGWDPYTSALRIVNWVYWDLAGNKLSNAAIESLANQLRFLRKNLETHIQANHLLVDFKGMYFASTYFIGSEANELRKLAATGLIEEIDKQFLQDGGHFELSPMYHGITTEDLIDVLSIQIAYPEVLESEVDAKLNSILRQRLPKMLRWLSEMRHPDGDYVLFNDAARGIAPTPESIIEFAQRCGVSPEAEREPIAHNLHSGHVRILSEDLAMFLDVGKVGASYQPGHAHADSLGFECSLFGSRFIVDSGTQEYAPGEIRNFQRSTAAHNTVEVDRLNSSEVWGAFRVARRAQPDLVDIAESESRIQVTAAHDGYRQINGGPIHKRQWVVKDKQLMVIDTLEGKTTNAISRFHLHPEVEAEVIDSRSAKLTFGERTIQFSCDHGNVELQETAYSPEFGVSLSNQVLAIHFSNPSLNQTFSWQ
ncbi:heparinase II/III family protein [bacterium]|nr:heparinase II/III family protein [bacterium]MDB4468610.1 heparinase II/III family protein [bacterium]MDB4483513.1 heparinase II/III family protein [bacterium]